MGAVVQLCFQTKKIVIISFFLFSFNMFLLFFYDSFQIDYITWLVATRSLQYMRLMVMNGNSKLSDDFKVNNFSNIRIFRILL